jgi:tRNA modification GTPase
MSDTIVAQSTPHGVSAIALIRVSGQACSQLLPRVIHHPSASNPQPRHATFSRFYDLEGNFIDELVWIFYPAESSYTGEPLVEWMPHGNPLICKKIMDVCCALGCRVAEPGEFTQRAYLNGKLNISQVEAVLDLIHAQSDRALFYARKQLTGESGNLIKGIVRDLTSIRAEIEAYIDFPEDELPPEDQEGPMKKIQRILDRLDQYHASARCREAIQNGIDTLIIGAPNVGKSSLMNALVGHRRALVSPLAGTTRDYLVEQTFIGDYLINLIDTAGLNPESNDQIETEGIQQTLDLVQRASFFLVVLDSTQTPPVLPDSVIQYLNPSNTLILENKVDLPTSIQMPDYLPHFPHIRISTLDRKSIHTLKEQWKERIADDLETRDEESVMFNLRQSEFIRKAHNELTEAQTLLRSGGGSELAAFHLIEASDALLQVNERIDNEDVLDDLFKRFCIGK